MITIIPPDAAVIRILGKQKKRENEAYRLLTYCIQCAIESGLLLYNTLTLELLFLSREEANRLTELDTLIDKWFLVPEGQDDQMLSEQVLEIARLLANRPGIFSSYTIFTTTACNARCPYCFEQEFSPRHMSPDTAERLVQFMMAHYGNQQISLHWFGGEPLVNQQVIHQICELLTAQGIRYQSSMISNGYLFDAENIQKAVDLWHLRRVQITLDGTEKHYNRIKSYISPEGSPFQRVMRNIGWLSDAGIHVSIRLNVSPENKEDLLALAEELSTRFGKHKNVSVYANPLYTETLSEQGKRQWTITCDDVLLEKSNEVQARLLALRLAHPKRLNRKLHLNHCMADNNQSVTVTPDGFLGRCEHFAESELFGHIDSPERDETVLASWKEYEPIRLECARCAAYPQCRILKKCPGYKPCTIQDDAEIRTRFCEQMRYEYECFLKKQLPAEDAEPTPENC